MANNMVQCKLWRTLTIRWHLSSVAFGISCAMDEMKGYLQAELPYQHHFVMAIPDELYAKLASMEGEKVGKDESGHIRNYRDGLIADMF